jgi:hypothetical protein
MAEATTEQIQYQPGPLKRQCHTKRDVRILNPIPPPAPNLYDNVKNYLMVVGIADPKSDINVLLKRQSDDSAFKVPELHKCSSEYALTRLSTVRPYCSIRIVF